MQNGTLRLLYMPIAIKIMRFNVVLVKKWTVFLAMLLFAVVASARDVSSIAPIYVGELPKEAVAALRLIQQGGPFPYEKDGVVFGNYEQQLPKKKRGYYHEFTVKTPRIKGRGAKRIISGGISKSSGEYYYTDDHYESFKRIQE